MTSELRAGQNAPASPTAGVAADTAAYEELHKLRQEKAGANPAGLMHLLWEKHKECETQAERERAACADLLDAFSNDPKAPAEYRTAWRLAAGLVRDRIKVEAQMSADRLRDAPVGDNGNGPAQPPQPPAADGQTATGAAAEGIAVDSLRAIADTCSLVPKFMAEAALARIAELESRIQPRAEVPKKSRGTKKRRVK